VSRRRQPALATGIEVVVMWAAKVRPNVGKYYLSPPDMGALERVIVVIGYRFEARG